MAKVKLYIQKIRDIPGAALYEAIDNSTGHSFFVEAISLTEAKRKIDENLLQFGLVRK